ncbi:alpha-glucosidase [Oscillospiraceae bacterium N12]|jgi:oligo-1,6-glucosidase|uniref:Alpha-glucosidase n=1 Tax=Jilunia laotingensis TaxID=2763675 RepID=A0A926IK57_9BACT|nr:alpha-glucosidase [Jilunia laotingensis]MBC8593547.1 alpha-glucosidase [Jilunia laotingensis]
MEQKREWWKGAVIYQIYPRSFKDSNGDGIGDLPGLTSKLDYVQSLGVDAIWLNPIFASPNDDNGYDISDYRDIMNEFGTMEDFDRLLRNIHKRGMKLILDLVVNHTSDEHPWFIAARSSRENPYYEFYHWWPAEKGTPPVRKSYFDEDGTAWKYNEATDSYYLHYFSRKQPDINWENPQVRTEVFDMMKFWFEKGIDGFRMDSIPLISKDISFPEINLAKYPDVFSYYAHGPHLHDYLHEMNREVLSKYDAMSVGEGSEIKPEEASLFVSPNRQELDMLYGFGPSAIRNETKPDGKDTGIEYSLIALKRMFSDWNKGAGDGWPAIYLGNHDQARLLSRFGKDTGEYREVSSKMLATFLLTMRGTAYWFAGDEIGMDNIKFENISDYKDVDTITNYKRILNEGGDTDAYLEKQKLIARDNARTPFQWDDSPNAGFTTGTPWIKVNPNYKTVNVTAEEQNPDSILNYFKKVIKFRKENEAFVYGDYLLLDAQNPRIYAYQRTWKGERFIVTLNFSPHMAKMDFIADMKNCKAIFCNYNDESKRVKNGTLLLRPFEAVIWK